MKKAIVIGLGTLLLSLAACATDAEIEQARKSRVGPSDYGDTSVGSQAYAVGVEASR